MKHVDDAFWDRFLPAIQDRATALGKPDFFVFGEVFSTDPILQSNYTNLGASATLDFTIDDALARYLPGGEGRFLTDAFDEDDWFTDPDSNATLQVSFFGNHDEGRMGYLLATAEASAGEDRLLSRARMANDLLFLTRGVPVVYYGDEQGFVGEGGDQLARHDLFGSQTPDYLDDEMIGTDDTDGPIFAFSRIDRTDRIEYLVVTNTDASTAETARLVTRSPTTEFTELRPGGATPISVTSDPVGEVSVEVPPLSTVILVAGAPVPDPVDEPTIVLVRPDEGTEISTARYRLEAETGDGRLAEVMFAVAIDEADPVVVGVDDAPPYRVYWSNGHVPDGARVDVIATIDDGSGRLRSDVVGVTIGPRP